MAKDPISGMTVDEASALHAERDGQTYYFCSEHCRQKFLDSGKPRVEGGEPDTATHDGCQSVGAVGNASGSKLSSLRSPPIYTCPMHPEVQQDHLRNFATFNAVYGAFGGIMALLLWINVSGCIFIFGACLCAAQAEGRSL